jgi:peptidoglycan/xylan/chitin deacetylase (PgdA/CDA1 family)
MSVVGAVSRLGKVVAGGVDLVSRPRTGVVVLIFHRVGGRTAVAVDQPTDLFDRQMAWLAQTGRVVSLDTAVDVLARGDAPADGSIVVTFDDGTADFATDALPILERHQIPATLYVATDFIERQIDFPDDGRPLSWSALRDGVATGLVTVGSHTHTHALLDRLPEPEVADELDRSIGLIADRLGVAATHFAYPKALPGSPEADRLVRDRFRSAAVARTRPNPYGRTDPLDLSRSPIQVADGMRWFERKADGGLWLEDSVRRLVNRRRYGGAIT